jgi:hypothetical protein
MNALKKLWQKEFNTHIFVEKVNGGHTN